MQLVHCKQKEHGDDNDRYSSYIYYYTDAIGKIDKTHPQLRVYPVLWGAPSNNNVRCGALRIRSMALYIPASDRHG